MFKLMLVVGIVAILLGALWLLQGLGIVAIRPILCVANCTPVQGPSATWTSVGGVMLALGGVLAGYARKRLRRRAR